ncbi:MAG: YbjN domain-containing protein [Symploca sp. SIO1C4]|uniref:YbjN domain-containing protein n=1 Tax=Symploca sp. SIO1C4 TaxID=2607765 RepID=A0A6B3NBE2_9CYAN|nr:YbjN domain-containing protein [Symploca sp. SIO1C4]NET04857.1 YbjN domain-containing protein [Symploca sp. SIO2B6]NET51031.1 YbjN domain-containing protein [Merismopedia sp. SIO2A8]
MSITFANNVQELTYRKVAEYLSSSNLFKDSMRLWSEAPQFDILYGSAMVAVEVLPWDVNPWDTPGLAIVRACSCVTFGSSIKTELMHYLLSENRRMRFGAFQLDENNQILFADSVLGGENMDLMELQTCILSVVTIADTYDDIIVEKFGGQRAVDRLSVDI